MTNLILNNKWDIAEELELYELIIEKRLCNKIIAEKLNRNLIDVSLKREKIISNVFTYKDTYALERIL